MLAKAAMQLLANVSYRPGWTLTATDVTWFSGKPGIMIKVAYSPPESDVRNAPAYEEIIDVEPEFFLDVSSIIDTEDFYREVFRILIAIELHEAREFFGIKTPEGPESYRKPVHPHTFHGQMEWATQYNPNFRNNRAPEPAYFD